MSAGLPLFHLYGDPPDDQAFDFIHVETIVSRSSMHDWLIRAHRHRNLFQILLVEKGGGEMIFEASIKPFTGALRDHRCAERRAWLSLSRRGHRRLGDELQRGRGADARRAFGRGDDAAQGDGGGADRRARCRARGRAACRSCATICIRKASWRATATDWRCARLLALIAIEVGRQSASRARSGSVTLAPADGTVETLKRMVEENFRKERQIGFYAERLAMTAGPAQRSRQARRRRHRRPPDPPARADRSQARAGLYRPRRSTKSPTSSASPTRRISRASSASRPA